MNKNQIKMAALINKYIKGKSVVDLGGGITELSSGLGKVLCVDIIDEGHTDIQQDLNDEIQIGYSKVDTVISSNLIEHLKRPLDFLKDVKRIMKKNARFILITPNGLGLQEILTNITGKYAGAERYNECLLHHIYVWNKYNMNLLIKEAGFKIHDFGYISHYWKRNYIFRFIAWIFPIFRPSLFYVLEK